MTSQSDRFPKTALFVTRVTAVGFGALAAWLAWLALQRERILPLALATFLGLLAWGTWHLRPKALGVAAGPLLFIALMLVVGAFAPFAIMQFLRQLAMSSLAIFAAACVDHVRVKRLEQPRSLVVHHLLMVVLLAACLVLVLACRLRW